MEKDLNIVCTASVCWHKSELKAEQGMSIHVFDSGRCPLLHLDCREQSLMPRRTTSARLV